MQTKHEIYNPTENGYLVEEVRENDRRKVTLFRRDQKDLADHMAQFWSRQENRRFEVRWCVGIPRA